MTTDGYSKAVKVDMTGWSIQAVWTGSPTGTFFVQMSNDNPFSGDPTNWTIQQKSLMDTGDITDGQSLGIGHKQCPYRWVRLGYHAVSGSGTLSATLNWTGYSK